MRPLIIGILAFLAWMVLSTWYYTSNIFPDFHPAEETTSAEVIPDTLAEPPETPPLPVVPDDLSLYFDFDKTLVLNTADLNNWLPACLEYLGADAGSCLELVGHTCDIGTVSYNMDLGMSRAEAVQSYLLKNGFSTSCIKVSSKGEAEPKAANTSTENRKLNRRVEVHINH